MEWEVVIGLETHTQLKTKSKIFSGSSIAFGAEPNTQASAVDIALPGVLPVLNKEAVKCAIKFGLAVNAEIAPRSVFNRKNYFYPDLPKGYQISQFELPVVGKGSLTIQVGDTEKVIRITRAHLEEDAGKSLHGDFEGMTGIDLNRAGTPLLEIVTEPDMRSAAEAVAYAKKLHELVQWIDICDGNMQEGSFRCDVNVSVRKKGSDKLGTRREIKNLNSFKFMQQAIEYETRWQIETLEDGGTIQQATVLFNPDTGETRSMRSKEEANDYRYFPDPDLLPLDISEADKAAVKADMPELPEAMKARFENQYTLSEYEAAILTSSQSIAQYFESAVLRVLEVNPAKWASDEEANRYYGKMIGNGISGILVPQLNKENIDIKDSVVSPIQFAELHVLLVREVISSKIARELFMIMWEEKATDDLAASRIVELKGLQQVSDSGAIEAMIDEVLAANATMVEEFKAGKEKAFNALVGQAMKASKGKANPAQVNEILKKKLTS